MSYDEDIDDGHEILHQPFRLTNSLVGHSCDGTSVCQHFSMSAAQKLQNVKLSVVRINVRLNFGLALGSFIPCGRL